MNLQRHFARTWWGYSLVVVFAILSAHLFANWKTAPKDYEKVTIFLGSKTAKEDLIQKVVEERKDKSCLTANILVYDHTDRYFGTFLSSAGSVAADVLILPKGKVSDNFALSYFAPLKEKELENYFGLPFSYEKVNEQSYGIQLSDIENPYLASFIDYSEEKADGFCLYFNRKSVNLNSIYPVEGNSSDHALKALKALLDYEK